MISVSVYLVVFVLVVVVVVVVGVVVVVVVLVVLVLLDWLKKALSTNPYRNRAYPDDPLDVADCMSWLISDADNFSTLLSLSYTCIPATTGLLECSTIHLVVVPIHAVSLL